VNAPASASVAPLAASGVRAGDSSRRWTTPRCLRAFVAAIWVGAALLFAVGVQALNAERRALKIIGRDTAPSIVAAQELGANLANLDTELASSLLGSAADRDVAQEIFELRRSTTTRRLVDVASHLTASSAERIPLLVMSEELGRYLELAARAQWLYLGGDTERAVSIERLATNLMHARILPAAEALDRASRRNMDAQYDDAKTSSVRFQAEAVCAGALVVGALTLAQVFVRRRMRRRVVPALLAATILAVGFDAYLFGRFRGARDDLRLARDDAFNSIHLLWRVRATSFDADGDEARFLLDRARAGEHDAAFRSKVTQISSRPDLSKMERSDAEGGRVTGLVVDELTNVTFPGEQAAVDAIVHDLAGYYAIDMRIRALEAQGKHAEAVRLSLGTRDGEAGAAFDRFDESVQRALAINQDAFDAALAAADRGLRRAEWLDPAFAFAIALLGWLGIRPRLREYAG
jgi:hypothetical protein